MGFNYFLLRGIWLSSIGKFIIISSFLLSILYSVYLSITDADVKETSILIFYIQTHFLVFNMVILPLYLLMASTMIHYYSHSQIKIKHSKISVLVKRQIALLLFHSIIFILIVNFPLLILSIFNGFEMLFFMFFSMLIQLPGYVLASSILLFLYFRSQQQGVSLLFSIVLLISPLIISTAIGVEKLHSLDYYIYLKNTKSFGVIEVLNESITFVLVIIFISIMLLLLTVRKGSKER